jgi:hypothetical protein
MLQNQDRKSPPSQLNETHHHVDIETARSARSTWHPRTAGASGQAGTEGCDRTDWHRRSSRRERADGETGPAGKFSPADRREVLNLVQGQLEEASSELLAQMKHLQSLKGELDELRANVASLIDSSS